MQATNEMLWKRYKVGDVVTFVAATSIGNFAVTKENETVQLRIPVAPGPVVMYSIDEALDAAQDFYENYTQRPTRAAGNMPLLAWVSGARVSDPDSSFGSTSSVLTRLPIGSVSITENKFGLQVLWPWSEHRTRLAATNLTDAKLEVEAGYVLFIRTEAKSLGLL